jgi:fumarate reductase iron-sulfur subunit
MSGSDSQTITVSVWRGNAGGGELQDFEVPQQPSQTILDVVTWIQRHLDTSLSYRFACRVGMCGSCAMMVNGIPRWTCRTHVNKVIQDGRITIEPLRNLPVIRDLACDMSEFFEKWKRAEGHFTGTSSRDDKVADISPRSPERQAANAAIECINCGICYASCDVVARRCRLSPVPFAAGLRDLLPERTQSNRVDRRPETHDRLRFSAKAIP